MVRTELPSTGGGFQVPAILQPTACPVSIGIAVPWLKLVDAAGLQFAAEPNVTQATREAVILIGSRTFFVRQVAPPQLGLAAAPSRLVFAVDQKGRSDKKVVTAWIERPSSVLTARTQHTWLVVTPYRDKQRRQMYEVSIRPDAALPPGRHDTTIELRSADAPNRSVIIPVVIEVVGRFY